MGGNALPFFHKFLPAFLAITFEPFEPDRCLTAHLKANDPLYTLPVVFLSWGISGIMVNVPWPLVNVRSLFGHQLLIKYFNQYLIVQNKEHWMTTNHVFGFI